MRLNLSNNASAVLQNDISASDTTITVDNTETLPAAPFPLTLNMTEEIVYVTKVSGNTLTVERGQEGTESKAYPSGTECWVNFTVGAYDGLLGDEFKNNIEGIRQQDDNFQYKINGEWIDLKGGSPVKVGNVSDLSAEAKAGLVNEISWKDPADVEVDGVKIATWEGTQLRGKVGSYPIDKKDGELLVDNTTRDKYASTPFKHEGLADGDKWHYMLFPYTEDGAFTVDSANRANATAIVKYTQDPPSTPEVTDIDHDRVTVTGGDVVSLNKTDWFTSPHTFTGLTEETEYTAYAKYNETETHLESPISVGKSFTTPSEADDSSGSPGAKDLIGGNLDAGYYGTVPASDLITGDALADLLGLSAGTSQHSDTDWLKFSSEGNVIFSPMKPIRYNLSWDDINAVNAVYGDKIIEIKRFQFKVRLWKGANKDPAGGFQGSVNHGSEWNKLMLPIHENAPSNWAYKDNVNSPTKDWGINFTDKDLLTHHNYGNGSYTWCQEVAQSHSDRVLRGTDGVSRSASTTSSSAYSGVGFRPVLELVK